MGNDLGRCGASGCPCQSFDARQNVATEALKGALIGGSCGAGGAALGIGIGVLAIVATGGAATPLVLTGVGSATGITAGAEAVAVGTACAFDADNHTCRCGHAKHYHSK